MDAVDKKILNILQENARTPNAAIAREVGMAASATLERIRKLKERGVIRGYGARLDPRALDRGLLAFVFVRTDEGAGAERATERLAAMPEVQEVHHLAGEDCVLAKVRVADTDALGHLLRKRVSAIGPVRSTRTTIVLTTVKEAWTLPVEAASEATGSEADDD